MHQLQAKGGTGGDQNSRLTQREAGMCFEKGNLAKLDMHRQDFKGCLTQRSQLSKLFSVRHLIDSLSKFTVCLLDFTHLFNQIFKFLKLYFDIHGLNIMSWRGTTIRA